MRAQGFARGFPVLLLVLSLIAAALLHAGQALAAGRLHEFLPKAQPAELLPGAERFFLARFGLGTL